MRTKCQENLYFLAKGVLGYSKLVNHYHKPLCEHVTNSRSRRKLSLLPRGTYKTTIITKANVIRLILIDPDIRILLVNATAKNAESFLWEIRTHFEKNQVLRWLFPELIPDLAKVNRWNNSEILVNRPGMFSEATVEAIGVGGVATSRHFNVHIKDDLINEETINSATELEKVKQWLTFSESLFVNPSTDLEFIVGTRYAQNDPYGDILAERIESVSDIPNFYGQEFESNGYLVYMRSAEENGKPSIPEILDAETLARLKKKGKFFYFSQYLNCPFTSEAKSFDMAWLRYYTFDEEGRIVIIDSHGVPIEGEKPIPRASLYVTMRTDPSTGESTTTRDRSANIVDGCDSKNRIFILEAWAKKCKYFELFSKMVEHYLRWRPEKMGLELVAGFKVLASAFREYCRKRNIYPNLVELKTVRGQNKEGRISSKDAKFEAGEIFIRKSMKEFMQEYEAFPDPSVPDDLLDAFAYGDQFWVAGIDTEAQEKWDREEATVLQFRKRSRTGY